MDNKECNNDKSENSEFCEYCGKKVNIGKVIAQPNLNKSNIESHLKVRIIMLAIIFAAVFSCVYQISSNLSWFQLLEKATFYSILAYEIDSFAFWIFVFWIFYISFRIKALKVYNRKPYLRFIVILWITSLVYWVLFTFSDINFSFIMNSDITIYASTAIIVWINYELNYAQYKKTFKKYDSTILEKNAGI